MGNLWRSISLELGAGKVVVVFWASCAEAHAFLQRLRVDFLWLLVFSEVVRRMDLHVS